VLLAVATGLRRGDIEAIRIGDIHFDRDTIATRNRKAGKVMPERPIPETIMTELSNYVAALPDGQEQLLPDKFSPKRWEKVRRAMGLPKLKFHDLRKTFASLLASKQAYSVGPTGAIFAGNP
jgi:integrase